MTRRQGVRAVAVLVLLFLAASGALLFWLLNPPATVSTASIALRPVSYSELEGWAATDPRLARDAFARSCTRLSGLPVGEAMTGAGHGGTAGDWIESCRHIPLSGNAALVRRWFEDNFVPVAISSQGEREGLFTGYYEPELEGSRKMAGPFRIPVYGRPDDLVDADLGAFRETLRGERISGRVVDRKLVPYFTRAEIDHFGLPHAPTLFFAEDPASVFFLQIQGSGRVHFADGLVERVAYDGQNGLPYTPIGRILLESGQIARAKMSMQAIKSWIDSHPFKSANVMEKDRSFVFFKELPLGNAALGSPGAEGVPLTPDASIAVDERLNVLGAPYYIVAKVPDADPARPDRALDQLVVAQDIGGAIRGGVRADVFFGYGKLAESLAGRMKSRGFLYVLLPRALARRVGAMTS